VEEKGRIETAHQNRDALRAQINTVQAELNRLNTLYLKWQGVCEYLESLQKEQSNDGSKGAGIPPKTVQQERK